MAATAKQRTRAKSPAALRDRIMEDPRLTARHLIELDEGYLHDLWLKYWGNGGNAQFLEFDAFVQDLNQQDDFDLRILGWAVEEVLDQAHPQ